MPVPGVAQMATLSNKNASQSISPFSALSSLHKIMLNSFCKKIKKEEKIPALLFAFQLGALNGGRIG